MKRIRVRMHDTCVDSYNADFNELVWIDDNADEWEVVQGIKKLAKEWWESDGDESFGEYFEEHFQTVEGILQVEIEPPRYIDYMVNF